MLMLLDRDNGIAKVGEGERFFLKDQWIVESLPAL